MGDPVYTGLLKEGAISGSVEALVQVTAPSNATLEILRAWVGVCTVTSCALQVRLARRTSAGTGTACNPVGRSPFDSSSCATVSVDQSASSTVGDEIYRDTVNALNGWLYLPVPEEREIVPPTCSIAIDFPIAPDSASGINAGIRWIEHR